MIAAPSVLPGHRRTFLAIANPLLAIALTLLTTVYTLQPIQCWKLCIEPEGTACPAGACRSGEQRAGWPLPVLVDDPGGGSPTGGWGVLRLEDPVLLGPFLLDVLFFSFLLWFSRFALYTILVQAPSVLRAITNLPGTLTLAILAWLIFVTVRLLMGGGIPGRLW